LEVYKRPYDPIRPVICIEEICEGYRAEIELNVLIRQCLNRRLDSIEKKE
jgi:hypothetical protein